MRTALVVIDFQNDFVDGTLGFPGAASIENAICTKLDYAHKHGIDIIFTMDTHPLNYLSTREGKHLPIEHCQKARMIDNENHGWDVHGRVAQYTQYAAHIIEKDRFGSLALARLLSDYDSVEFCGLVSNICVLSNIVLCQTFSDTCEYYVDLQATTSYDPVVNSSFQHYLEALQVNIVQHTTDATQ